MSLVCIGKIIKPQGIKGEVKIYPLVDSPAVFNNKVAMFIDKKAVKVETCSYRNSFAYAKFDVVTDRNAAEKFRNALIYITKEDFYKFSQNEYLLEDLIGEKIYCDGSGEYVGQIMGVENYGSDDLIVVKEADERTYLVPFVSAIFINNDDGVFVVKKEYEGAKVDYED